VELLPVLRGQADEFVDQFGNFFWLAF